MRCLRRGASLRIWDPLPTLAILQSAKLWHKLYFYVENVNSPRDFFSNCKLSKTEWRFGKPPYSRANPPPPIGLLILFFSLFVRALSCRVTSRPLFARLWWPREGDGNV